MGKYVSLLLFVGFFLAFVLPVSAQVPSPAKMQFPGGGGGGTVPQSGGGGGGGPKGGCALEEVSTDLGCFPNDPIKFVQKFYGIGLGFVASVSLIALILGGYDIMTSRGDLRRLNIGKSYIFYVITGLLLAIFGYVIIRVIVVDILRIPGFA